jgi:hypothetical protein
VISQKDENICEKKVISENDEYIFVRQTCDLKIFFFNCGNLFAMQNVQFLLLCILAGSVPQMRRVTRKYCIYVSYLTITFAGYYFC